MKKTEWIRCLVCGNKTRLQIREDTRKFMRKYGDSRCVTMTKEKQMVNI
ncbi:MAG: cysteine-rich KTR domain-containing protein [Lachnospiraceae bacterium]|nr:cysteine-rich KTR domain-containing protein [Lachnospiraceae bacterium]